MKTIAQFIEEHGLTMIATRKDSNPNMQDMPRGSRHYLCMIQTQESFVEVPFSMGPALKDEPTLAEVLDCLASDATGYENARGSFEEWASEYGYDTDSRKAEATFKAVEAQAMELERLLGLDAYNELLWNLERE